MNIKTFRIEFGQNISETRLKIRMNTLWTRQQQQQITEAQRINYPGPALENALSLLGGSLIVRLHLAVSATDSNIRRHSLKKHRKAADWFNFQNTSRYYYYVILIGETVELSAGKTGAAGHMWQDTMHSAGNARQERQDGLAGEQCVCTLIGIWGDVLAQIVFLISFRLHKCARFLREI